MFNSQDYLEKGYTICEFNPDLIKKVFASVVGTSDFSTLHRELDAPKINEIRLKAISEISIKEVKEDIYQQLKSQLSEIVGVELAIQKKININIHLPGNGDFLQPLHSDVLCGNSPYEVVVWIPLVDVSKSQSFYLYSYEDSIQIIKEMKKSRTLSSIEEKYKENRQFVELKEGQALFFFPGLIHGNIVNEEELTRVSLNLRFKNFHSPYHDKKLFEYFEKINLSMQTRLAIKYQRDIDDESI